MTTKVNCGQVRGPVQINFARSIDPIVPQEITITRVAVTSKEDAEKKEHEMGRKHIVPYALYRVEGYISANLAQKVTGFDDTDLDLLWESLINLFEHDHSAARGKMATRKLFVFKHDSALGCLDLLESSICLNTITRQHAVRWRRENCSCSSTIQHSAVLRPMCCSIRFP